MLTSILMASLTLTGPGAEPSLAALARHGHGALPYIEVWTNRDEVLRRGDKVKLYFRTDVDAYVTVFRVDTDGRVRVLFPLTPWADNYAVGGVRYQVDPRDDGYTFRVDDYPGQGYLFAVASLDPFAYAPVVRGEHWDYRLIGTNGRMAGDPYVAIGEVIAGIVPSHYADYNYDVVPYFVEQRYDYPRFLCYDCHAYASYPYWDPYAHSCFKFRIVIYDDPYYYPARVRYGTRVVYQRPPAAVPRYVFKDRAPGDSYVVTLRERPVDGTGRRQLESGATRRSLPGGVLVPTPRPVASEPATLDVRRGSPPAGVDAPDRPTGRAPAPTLERRDPARTPTGAEPPDARRTSPPRVESPKPAAPRRAEPAKPAAKEAKPSPPAKGSGSQPARKDPPKPPKKNDAPPKRRN